MKPASDHKKFSLDDLASLSGLPRRTVRYYIQIGLVDRPIGETRAAHYTPGHLDRLLTVRKWTDAGVSLERVRELLEESAAPVPLRRVPSAGSVEVRSHLTIREGVELVVEPGRAGLSPEQLRKLFREVLAVSAHIGGKGESE